MLEIQLFFNLVAFKLPGDGNGRSGQSHGGAKIGKENPKTAQEMDTGTVKTRPSGPQDVNRNHHPDDQEYRAKDDEGFANESSSATAVGRGIIEGGLRLRGKGVQ